MTKFVGIIYNTGRTGTDKYNAARVGAVDNDLLRDERVVNYKTGFSTEAEAQKWADDNVR